MTHYTNINQDIDAGILSHDDLVKVVNMVHDILTAEADDKISHYKCEWMLEKWHEHVKCLFNAEFARIMIERELNRAYDDDMPSAELVKE